MQPLITDSDYLVTIETGTYSKSQLNSPHDDITCLLIHVIAQTPGGGGGDNAGGIAAGVVIAIVVIAIIIVVVIIVIVYWRRR